MPVVVLSPVTAQALSRLLNQHPATDQGKQGGGEFGAVRLHVQCTSVTPAGGAGVAAECFPAVVVDHDSTLTLSAQPTLVAGTVWLSLIGGGVPKVGTVYHGQLSGEFNPGSDNRPRVFAVPGGGALQSVEVVTNVQCVSGNLVVTYKTLTGRDLVLT